MKSKMTERESDQRQCFFFSLFTQYAWQYFLYSQILHAGKDELVQMHNHYDKVSANTA